MLIIDRYVQKELLRGIGTALVLFVFLFMLGAVFQPLHSGLSLARIAPLMPIALLYSLKWSLPASTLGGVIAVYGRLTEDNEIVGMKAAGIHPWVMIRSTLATGAAVAGALVYLNGWAVPYTQQKKAEYLLRLAAEDPLFPLKAGEITVSIGGYSIFVKDVVGQELKDVIVYNRDDSGRMRTITAKEAEYSFNPARRSLTFHFRQGVTTVARPDESPLAWDTFSFEAMDFNAEVEGALERKVKASALTIPELCKRVREAGLTRKKLAQDLTEIHSRLALSAIAVSFAVMGIALGMLIRRGSFIGSFTAAVVVLLGLYGTQTAVDDWCSSGRVPHQVIWVPALLIGLAGSVLLWRVVRR